MGIGRLDGLDGKGASIRTQDDYLANVVNLYIWRRQPTKIERNLKSGMGMSTALRQD